MDKNKDKIFLVATTNHRPCSSLIYVSGLILGPSPEPNLVDLGSGTDSWTGFWTESDLGPGTGSWTSFGPSLI
ncbi:15559_t:CDS:2 [Gigaspora rosea]|nr:15559_t:CDS:2 [Gigaspora rosea]